MGTPGSSTRITLDETLDAFDRLSETGEPLTASEVAEALDCSRRTAYDKLDALAERGDLESKKTGARGRIWWRQVDDAGDDEATVPEARPLDSDDHDGGEREGSIAHVQFEELVQAVTDYAIFVLDAEGQVASWNDGAEQIKGYAEAEIVGEHFSTFYTEADREAGVPERNLATAEADGHIEDEGWRVQQSGDRFWANVTITSMRAADGEVEGYIKVTRDMTEARAHEERLRQEKERFESLVQEVEDYAIFMLDPEGRVQSWNRGIERIKGYAEAEIVGEHFSTFYTEADREADVPERNLAVAAEEGRTEDEGWRVRNDGSQFWADVVITALRDDDGELHGYAKVTRDMTDQHEYEQQLLRQRNELDELNRINEDIRDVDRALVAATSLEEIETAVCERLSASGSYSAAWIADYGADYEELTPSESAGVDESFLEAVVDGDADGDDRPVERELGTAALRTGSVQTRQDLREAFRSDARRTTALDQGFESVAAIPLVYNEVEYGVLTVYADDERGFDERQTTVLGEFGETISHAIAAVRRKEREQTLTALHGSTRDLLHAETDAEIGEVVVDAATEYLDLPDVLVYRFDTTDNVLEPLTVSSRIEALDATPRQYAPGNDSVVWTSFVDGDPIVVETADDDAFPSGRTLGVQGAMLVPLGDHGVLAIGSRDGGRFDRNTRKLVELLGATAQAAFTRVENEANLRERDSVLQDQNRRLQRLNQLNGVVRDVEQHLVGATTREEIHGEVCDLLTTNDRFRLAWIGEIDPATDAVRPVAWNGTGRGYLDSVSLDGDGPSADPGARAARTGEMTVVSNIADDLRTAPWRTEAFSREFQSAIAIPLAYGDRHYGVLTVYADRPGMFGEMERSILAELGHTIATAINTAEMKQALFADRTVELEFRLPADADSVLMQLARETGCQFEFEGAVETTGGGVRIFFTTRDGSPEDVVDALEASVAVESGGVIDAGDDGSLFQAVVSGQVVAATLVEHNASLRTFDVTGDGANIIVDLPSSEDVRDFVEQFQAAYPGVEFVARRERDRPIETPAGFRSRMESTLTDRQFEVLEMAYRGGFFESPRRSTGGDIAAALDVSQPTMTGHLRSAQRKLLDLVLDEP